MTAEPIKKGAFEQKAKGEKLDFSHLDPVDLTCPTLVRPDGARIKVTFSCHCYTEAYDDKAHKDRDVVLDQGNRKRAVCPVRFEHSKLLPGLIAALPDSHVYLTPESNYVRLATADGEEYRVYFNMKPFGVEGYDLRMFVESAYQPDKPGLPASKMQKVRFKVMIDKLLKGERLKFGRR